MSISGQTWKLRGLYFFFFSGLGTVIPYLPLLLTSPGSDFSPAAIGLLLSVSPLVGIVAPPLWGSLADRIGRTTPLLRLQLLALPMVMLLVFHARGFWAILLLLTLLSVFLTPFAPLADHITLEYTHRDGVDYGRVRVFGSLGFSLANLFVGWFLTHGPVQRLDLVYLPLLFSGFILSWFVRERNREAPAPVVESGGHATVSTWILLRPLFGFFAIVFTLSLTFPTYYTFFPLYIHQANLPIGSIPLAFMISSGSEIFTMPIATRVFQRFGPRPMLALAAASYSVRWLVVATLHSLPLVIGIQALHGISFGFFYTASVAHIRSQLDKRVLATGQGVFGGVNAIGNVTGNILGGMLFERALPVAFFGTEATLAGSAALLFWILCCRRPRSRFR